MKAKKTTDLPKVSVLISVYNQLHCLDKALSSVLSQDYSNLEIIIGDDCSSDGDLNAFISKFKDNRIVYIKNKENLGANANYRNMLFNCSSGEYAIVLNADDYWIDNHFISQAIELFQNDINVSLVFGAIKTYISLEDRFIEDHMHKELPEIMRGNLFFINYTMGYSLPHLSCLYNRQKAIDLDFYNSNVVSTDWEYLLKIIINQDIGIIHHTVGVLTKHTDNYTKATNLSDLVLADLYIHNVHKYASETNAFDPFRLEQWKNKMLRRHHTKWLIKLWFLDPGKIPEYENFLNDKYPLIFKRIKNDFRYKGFLRLKRFPNLLKFLFRIIYRHESFIADLIAFNKGVNEL